MMRNQLVEIIYVAKNGEISKRKIKVIHVSNQSITAYCFVKKARRSFLIDNILSLLPVIRKERDNSN